MRTKQIAALVLVLQICTCGIQSAEQPVSGLANLVENGPNAVAWILSPLSGTLPSEIRQNLIFLREDLLDEGKTKTEVERVPYRVGYSLCASLLAALDERDAFAIRAQLRSAQVEARTQPTERAIAARRNYKMSWPQYERELEQREDVKRQEAGITELRKDQAKVEWLEKATMLRRVLDIQYAAFRKELREAGILAVSAKIPEVLNPTQSPDHKSKEHKSLESPNPFFINAGKFTNSIKMSFVAVPGTDVFMCIHETRNRDYWAYTSSQNSVGSSQQSEARAGEEDHPVIIDTFEQAAAFCQWLTNKEKMTYRLPTDQEWSLAVSGKKHPWGDEFPPSPNVGNYAISDDGFSGTSPVMSYQPNNLGIYDLGGNVWEWCDTLYFSDINNLETKQAIPKLENVAGGIYRILRGASWQHKDPIRLGSSYRDYGFSVRRNVDRGFRCVVVVRTKP